MGGDGWRDERRGNEIPLNGNVRTIISVERDAREKGDGFKRCDA
jgi:hypothetical protein